MRFATRCEISFSPISRKLMTKPYHMPIFLESSYFSAFLEGSHDYLPIILNVFVFSCQIFDFGGAVSLEPPLTLIFGRSLIFFLNLDPDVCRQFLNAFMPSNYPSFSNNIQFNINFCVKKRKFSNIFKHFYRF